MSFYTHTDKQSWNDVTVTNWNNLSGAVGGNSGVTLACNPGDKIGIGTTAPEAKLQIGNTIAHRGSYTYAEANTSAVIHAKDHNGGNTPAATQSVLSLLREGIAGEAYGNMADFRLGRYENASVDSRSQLDIYMADGYFSPAPVMSMRATGHVGIGTTSPGAPLSIGSSNGKENGPDTAMHITSNCILFGGNNAGKETNSAQISAGKHQPNSLNIVGMASGTAYTDRRVDVFAEGGFIVRGNVGIGTTTPASTSKLHIVTSSGNTAVFEGGGGVRIKDVTGDKNALFVSNNTTNYPAVAFSNNGTGATLYVNQDGSGPTAVFGSGNVGIGATVPQRKLHIKYNHGGPDGMRIERTDGAYWDIIMNNGYPTSDRELAFFHHNSASPSFWIEALGGYGVPSDRSLKEDIEPLDNVLSRVLKLRPSEFYMKRDETRESKSIGFIAQEVEEVFPQLVKEKGDIKSLSYDSFGVLSIAAIKELKEAYDKKIRALEKKMAALEKKQNAA